MQWSLCQCFLNRRVTILARKQQQQNFIKKKEKARPPCWRSIGDALPILSHVLALSACRVPGSTEPRASQSHPITCAPQVSWLQSGRHHFEHELKCTGRRAQRRNDQGGRFSLCNQLSRCASVPSMSLLPLREPSATPIVRFARKRCQILLILP